MMNCLKSKPKSWMRIIALHIGWNHTRIWNVQGQIDTRLVPSAEYQQPKWMSMPTLYPCFTDQPQESIRSQEKETNQHCTIHPIPWQPGIQTKECESNGISVMKIHKAFTFMSKSICNCWHKLPNDTETWKPISHLCAGNTSWLPHVRALI